MELETIYLQVLRKQREADRVVSLELGRIDGAPLPEWQPGAHIELTLPNGQKRQYSLCGDLACRDIWQIAILNDPHSRGGSRLIHENVAVGDVLTSSLPRNQFPLVSAPAYIMVAGGIGITPILPMIDRIARSGAPWRLIYGGRSRASMAFLDKLSSLPASAVEILPQDEIGLIDLDLIDSLVAPVETALYCCGPEVLISAVEARFRNRPGISLYRERFAASAKGAPGDGSFEIELARSGRILSVPPFESPLRILREAGCDVPYSCEAGICGTCAVRVISGTPDHRDDVLTDEERQAANVMLPCVSRALSSRLVLDI